MAEKTDVESAIEYYLSILNFRSREIFSDFFVRGYKYTQVDTVMEAYHDDVFSAKMYLGMLITLIDDLADNPKCYNPKLLHLLYSDKPVNKSKLSDNEVKIVNLKNFLVKNMRSHMRKLPNYDELIHVFNFDLEKVYLSNKFSELITSNISICNDYEMKLYGSYTMGVLPAGMIDLMGVKNIHHNELGKCREIFITGQRLAKIANCISTFEREQVDGDITNEIMNLLNTGKGDFNYYKSKLEKEFLDGIKAINKSKNNVITFDVVRYSHGVEKLFDLHMALIGKI